MRRFNSLPADVRKILEDTARETQSFVYARAQKEDDELRGKFAASGMKVNQVDKDAFIAASKSIYEEYGQEVPGSMALIQQAISLGK
jgi:TRAP-type C4-dicarboxylate transport system substrate-binding protein